jgi:hypothetical protein
VCSSCETDLTYSLWLVSGGIVRGSQAKQSDEVAVRWPPAVADRHWAAGVAVAGIESAASPPSHGVGGGGVVVGAGACG